MCGMFEVLAPRKASSGAFRELGSLVKVLMTRLGIHRALNHKT